MALEVVWSDEANEGLDEIIEHLEHNWTEKEVRISYGVPSSFRASIFS